MVGRAGEVTSELVCQASTSYYSAPLPPPNSRLTDVSQRSGCFSQPCGRMSPMEPTDPTAANVTAACACCAYLASQASCQLPQWSDDI